MLGEYFIGGKYQGQFYTESETTPLPQKIVDDITERVTQRYRKSIYAQTSAACAIAIAGIDAKVVVSYRLFGTKLQPLKKVILCYSFSDLMNCAMLMHTFVVHKKKAVVNPLEKRFTEIAIPC